MRETEKETETETHRLRQRGTERDMVRERFTFRNCFNWPKKYKIDPAFTGLRRKSYGFAFHPIHGCHYIHLTKPHCKTAKMKEQNGHSCFESTPVA